jgi:hypothetical protein
MAEVLGVKLEGDLRKGTVKNSEIIFLMFF